MPCRVGGGDPPASVGWLKDGSTLVGAQPRASLLENGTLQITGLRVSRPGAGGSGHPPPGAPMGWHCRDGRGGAVGAQGGGCSGWRELRVVGAKGGRCDGRQVLRLVGARGGGCKGRWVLRVVGARGGRRKGLWVERAMGAQGGVCKG